MHEYDGLLEEQIIIEPITIEKIYIACNFIRGRLFKEV